MISDFVTNVSSCIPLVLNFFQPFLQYMFTNPIVGLPFIMFVVLGFTSMLLHIKNILKEGIKS